MKGFLWGALCAFPMVSAWLLMGGELPQWDNPTSPISPEAVDKWRWRWGLLLLAFWWHWKRCSDDIAQSVKAKQSQYFKDLTENHATLGHLINVNKYAKYNVYREADLVVSARAYWGGLAWIALFALILWFLPRLI